MDTIKNILKLDATKLKIIAIILMVFDHIHQMWQPVGAPMWLTWLGRPVFPIFLFAMAESFHYTRNRKSFLKRLLFASWIMTICSTLLQIIIPNDNIMLMNNAFMTFFMAGLYMVFWDMFITGIKEKKAKKIIGSILLCFVPILTSIPFIIVGALSESGLSITVVRIVTGISLLLPNILVVEGSLLMVVLGVLFYILRKWRLAQIGVLTLLSVAIFVLNNNEAMQYLMILAIIPMLLYNGEKGRGMKNFFYIFYPAHIYILYIIATLFK